MATIMSNLAPPDDDMEISSDIEHGGNRADIEVDVDLVDEEDYMIDDSTGDNDLYLEDPTKDDDLMIDDGEDEIVAQDGPMEDDVDLRDEELLDIPLLNDRATNDVGQLGPTVASNLPDIQITVTTPLNLDQKHNFDSTDTPLPTSTSHLMNHTEDDIDPHDEDTAALEAASVTDSKEEPPAETVVSEDRFYVHGQTKHDADESSQPSLLHSEGVIDVVESSLHNDLSGVTADAKVDDDREGMHTSLVVSAPHSSEPNELVDRVHPVVVKYYEEEVYLFRSADATDARSYFLDDESLVFESLKDILKRCREVLVDSVDEHSILELVIPKLDLVINEDSPESGVMTLHEILTLYLQLSENDGVSNPAPLVVNLAPRFRLTPRWEQLKLWASEGYGLNSLDTTSEDGDEPSSAEAEHSDHQIEGDGTVTNSGQQGPAHDDGDATSAAPAVQSPNASDPGPSEASHAPLDGTPLEGAIGESHEELDQEGYDEFTAELGNGQLQPHDGVEDDVEDDDVQTLSGSVVDESHIAQADDDLLDNHSLWQQEGDMAGEEPIGSGALEEHKTHKTRIVDRDHELRENIPNADSLGTQQDSALPPENAENAANVGNVSSVGEPVEVITEEVDPTDESLINYEDDGEVYEETDNGVEYTEDAALNEAVLEDDTSYGDEVNADDVEAEESNVAAQSNEDYLHASEKAQPHTDGGEAEHESGHTSPDTLTNNSPNDTVPASPKSVGGTATRKRSYDAFEDVFDQFEPDSKKARPA